MHIQRRSFLTGLAAASLLNAQPAKTLKVVVVGGHPGDPEYGCGGTVARYAEHHHQVTLLYLNRGEKGCGAKSQMECGQIRSSEAAAACRLLGASAKFADQIDGEAGVNAATYDKFFALVQAENPDVLFTHWPLDNHRDHRAAFQLSYDAWLHAKKRFGLYFYEVSDGEDTVMFSPTDYVDISGVEAKKHAACFAHASQSPEKFFSLQSQVTQFRGVESGHRQAEAFIRHHESPAHLLP